MHPGADYYESEAVALYSRMHADGTSDQDERYAYFLKRFGYLEGQRVLDAGCGNGAFLGQLRADRTDRWGFDIDVRSLAVARSRGLENVFQSTLEAFLARVRTDRLAFDTIVAFDVVEHVTAPRDFLGALVACLRPGGRFFMTVPNRERLLAETMVVDYPPHHFFRFDRASARNLLTSTGLERVEVDTFQYGYAGPAALDWLRRGLKQRLPATRSITRTETIGSATTIGDTRSLRKRGMALFNVAARALVPPSRLCERLLRQGFKLAATGCAPRGC